MLSGLLLNVALFAVLRFKMVMAANSGALAPMSPTRIPLGGLEIGETNALLTVVAGFPVSARALETVIERTDGNPFFVTELARLSRYPLRCIVEPGATAS